MSAPHSPVTDLYTAIADDIEGRNYPAFPAFHPGREVWRSAYQSAATLFVHPAMEGLRRHLKLDEVQRWDTDKDAAVAALRRLAGAGNDPLGGLRDTADTRRILNAGAALRDALGIDGNDDASLGQLADYAGRRVTRLERENAELRDEVKRLKDAEATR